MTLRKRLRKLGTAKHNTERSRTMEGSALRTDNCYWLPAGPAESKVSGGSKKHLCQRAESDNVPAFHCCRAGRVAAIMPPSAESKITTMPASSGDFWTNSP